MTHSFPTRRSSDLLGVGGVGVEEVALRSRRVASRHGALAARDLLLEEATSGQMRATELRAHAAGGRSEEHTSELQSLMRISYAVFCLKKKTINNEKKTDNTLITESTKQTDT